jgi:hypothetical protein
MAAGSRSSGSGKCQAKSQGRSEFQADGWQRRGPAFAAVAATRGKAGLAVAADRTQVELHRTRTGRIKRKAYAFASRYLISASRRRGQSKRLNRQLAETVQPFRSVSIAWSAPFPHPVWILRGIAWNGSLRPAVCPAVPDQCPILRPRRGLGASRSGPVSPGSPVYRCAVRSTRSVAL